MHHYYHRPLPRYFINGVLLEIFVSVFDIMYVLRQLIFLIYIKILTL